MDRTQARLGLLGMSAAIVAVAGLDLLANNPAIVGADLMLVAVAAVPVAALATACLVPESA